MMSVNQMCVYHTVIEAYNVVKYSSSKQIKMKWEDKFENTYSLRSETKNSLKILHLWWKKEQNLQNYENNKKSVDK